MGKLFCLFFLLFFVFEAVHGQDLKETKVSEPDFGESSLILKLSSLRFFDIDFLKSNSFRENISARFSIPGSGKVISRFGIRSGRSHTGTDIKMPKGDTIYAAFDGQVSKASYYYGYGNLVVLDHPDNLQTYYGHLSAFLVKKGDVVQIGEPIGLAGATGRATTSHLHFEIRENEKPYNPELVFDFENSLIREDAAKADCLADLFIKQANIKDDETKYASAPQHYTVRSGDSLWNISRRFKVTIQNICSLNDLTEETILQVGQVLKLF